MAGEHLQLYMSEEPNFLFSHLVFMSHLFPAQGKSLEIKIALKAAYKRRQCQYRKCTKFSATLCLLWFKNLKLKKWSL